MVGLGFVSRNASRNIRGRAQGKVQLLPLIIVVRTRLHRRATAGWLTWETSSLCGWSSWSGGRACRWPSACSTRPPAEAGSLTLSGCSRRGSPRSRTPWQHSSRGAWCTHPCEWKANYEKPLEVLWKVYLGPQAEYGVLRNLKKLQLAEL